MDSCKCCKKILRQLQLRKAKVVAREAWEEEYINFLAKRKEKQDEVQP